MCNFRVRVGFLLICIFGQMSKFQGMQGVEENPFFAGLAESVLDDTSEKMIPINPRRPRSQRKENYMEFIDVNNVSGPDSGASHPRGLGNESNTCQEQKDGIKNMMDDKVFVAEWQSLAMIEEKIADWRSHPQFLQTPKISKIVASERMMLKIKRLATSLFTQRVIKIPGYSSCSEDKYWTLGQKKKQELLESVRKIAATWATLSQKEKESVGSIIQIGNEIMIDLLISLKTMNIISDGRLTHFLNKEDQGQVILSYAFYGFQKAQYPFLNLNLRQSLAESPFQNKIKSLLKFLDEQTWKSIEIAYLTTQLKAEEVQKFPNKIQQLLNISTTCFALLSVIIKEP
ncbi:hypothetical protein PCASD_18556 [Puccinia coronata f. sp. avenae]|uniref:Uncharacterized protein n=1 Tax=Puccinia coronata f. sp. avenae TaxID=200324 RepID=A0A2N5U110_9BASI|nr:hypothetical protein PCASD_18556 [Puccinia coronata f. sp. avenae]